MMTTAETAVRERIASGPFTVADLHVVADAILADAKAATSLVGRVVQTEVSAKRIRRLGGGKWGVCEPPKPREDDDDDVASDAIAGWRAMKETRQGENRERLVAAEAQLAEVTTGLARLGLRIIRKSEYHFHVVRRCHVVVQWWPSTGRTMYGQGRGPRCETPAEFVAWLGREFGEASEATVT